MSFGKKTLLIGTGYMAIEYTKVLIDLSIDFITVGRSVEGCHNYYNETGISPILGGIENFINGALANQDIKTAIVAVSADKLSEVTLLLLQNGFTDILTEKPAGLTLEDVKILVDAANSNNAHLYVGYNRRHFASTIKAREIIDADGGVLSCNFEFTEWGHLIKKLNHPTNIRNAWLIANSTHVIDLAFFIAGFPTNFATYSSGKLDWSSCKAIYAGSGVTNNGVLFTYNANWIAPGRWGVEWLTSQHRIIMRPLETISIQNIGEVNIEPIKIDTTLDEKYKPGLYAQVSGFLGVDLDAEKRLKTIEEHYKFMTLILKISGKSNE